MDSFWQDKNVLVTGAGGFIGSTLVETLASRGAKVRAFVRYNSRNDPGLLSLAPAHLRERIQIIAGDLRDLPAVQSAVAGTEIVFHLGALIAIPYSYLHPLEVAEVNLMGTLNILQACRDLPVTRLVHTSTSEVYGTAQYVPIDEKHPLVGQSPYSASKIGADKLAESYYCAFSLPVVTVRPFNTYGPRQSARAVIPTIISQALSCDELRLGSLDTRRDFTYVTDTVEGFLCAAQTSGIEGQTFNLGTSSEVTIQQIVDLVFKITGRSLPIDQEAVRLRPGKSEVLRLLSDNRKAKEILGWAPQVTLEQGLRQTVEWIRENLNCFDPGQYQR